jgi:PIN domain nuclease of toxin-antitoxin system
VPRTSAEWPERLLLDTQLLLWSAIEPERVPLAFRRRLETGGGRVVFSLASIWEVAIKQSLARPSFDVDPAGLRTGLLDAGFLELPIRAEHVLRVGALPWVHRDPFDRLLVAQAWVEDFTLATVDRTLAGYGVPVRVIRPRASVSAPAPPGRAR